jgi:predicted small secreted protein
MRSRLICAAVPETDDGTANPMEVPMKAFIALLVGSIFSTFLLAGCNTIEGAGKDVKAAGQKVEGEAQEHKRY